MNTRQSSFIPILLLVALAAVSLWLERSIRPQAGDGAKFRHDPDFWSERFSVKTFDNSGKLKSTLTAARMTHYPDDETSHLDDIVIRYHGQTSVSVSGPKGLVSKDGKQVSLVGGAVITREGSSKAAPATQVQTQILNILPDEERAYSDLPVTITQGASVIRGGAMDVNHATGLSVLSGRVTGTIQKQK